MTREQFIAHVESTQGAFRRFLVALCCGDTALADDIAQESYIKAYLASDSFTNVSKFNAWIYRIGYTTFIDHKRSVRVFVDIDEVYGEASDAETDGTFRYQRLYAALNALSPKERTSVLLFYMEGYSVKEISEIAKVSTSAVKQHLARGRNHLRGLLTNE